MVQILTELLHLMVVAHSLVFKESFLQPNLLKFVRELFKFCVSIVIVIAVFGVNQVL